MIHTLNKKGVVDASLSLSFLSSNDFRWAWLTFLYVSERVFLFSIHYTDWISKERLEMMMRDSFSSEWHHVFLLFCVDRNLILEQQEDMRGMTWRGRRVLRTKSASCHEQDRIFYSVPWQKKSDCLLLLVSLLSSCLDTDHDSLLFLSRKVSVWTTRERRCRFWDRMRVSNSFLQRKTVMMMTWEVLKTRSVQDRLEEEQLR